LIDLSLADESGWNPFVGNASDSLETIITIVVTLVISFLTINAIVKPVLKAMNLTKGIADGDLTNRLNMDQKDEIGTLSDSLDEYLEKSGEKRAA